MATKTTTALATPLRNQLDRLAAFDPSQGPVISLYLNLRPDSDGQRHHIDVYLKHALAQYPEIAAAIERHVADDVPKSAQGLAVFIAPKSGLFESVPLDIPVNEHEFYVGPVPHLYPLARLSDQYPRYAALLLNTDSARLFVFGLGATERRETVQNEKTRRSAVGGWSQARYQRRAHNMHKAHMKEVVTMLDRVVTDEHINRIVVACDDTTRPFLMEQLSKHLAEKVIDLVHLDVKGTPNHEVLKETLEILRGEDAKSDAEEVERAIGASRGGGLGAVGVDATLKALEMRQVETLLISANPSQIGRKNGGSGDVSLIDQLVARAQQNAARIRFIEDDALLADVGGVAAILRFKIG
jgi:protein required for attachment to host cells